MIFYEIKGGKDDENETMDQLFAGCGNACRYHNYRSADASGSSCVFRICGFRCTVCVGH